MDCLVGYGSDDENDDRFDQMPRGGGNCSVSHRDDDTNYDDVTMDMSEDSNNNESEPELPPADAREEPRRRRETHPHQAESQKRGHRRDGRDHRDSRYKSDQDKERHDSKRDHNYHGGSSSSGSSSNGRHGLLGDKPDDRNADAPKVPALMDLKPFGGEPPSFSSRDSKDSKNHRGSDRDRDRRVERRDRDRESKDRDRGSKDRDRGSKDRDRGSKDRDRGSKDRDRVSKDRDRGSKDRDRGSKERSRESRDKDRHSRRSPERSSRRRSRSRSRDKRRVDRASLDEVAPYPSRSIDARGLGASGDYRPSYKVSKKLQVMEKMGLQIKTPDGSMATAQQLKERSAAEHSGGPVAAAPAFFKPGAPNLSAISAQLQKRKLLWGNKSGESSKEVAPALPAAAAKWSGTKFAQDKDGKQTSKFLRLMGVKDPNVVQAVAADAGPADVNKKQEEMFQAMQAQYDVARATTHTMRGVGLGFQRHL